MNIAQLPGLLLLKDRHSTYIEGSVDTATLFGFDSAEALVGLTDFDIQCPAVSKAQSWVDQDRVVLKTQRPLTVLDVESYAHNDVRALLIHKRLYRDEMGKAKGIFCSCIDINHNTLKYIQNTLNVDFAAGDGAQLTLNGEYTGFELTTRESQCLFYTLRGYTAEGIAQKLSRSRRTVEVYLDNIKTKMQCQSKSELIEKCIVLGFVHVVPAGVIAG